MKGIYAYYDLENKYYAYVGKDNNITYNHRHKCHKSQAYYNDQPFNKVLQNNPERYEYQRLIELPDNITDNFLNNLEEHYIKILKTFTYDNRNKHVFNFTKGGDGSAGYKHKPEIIEEMKRNQCFKKGQTAWNKGKKLTDEQNAHNRNYDAKVKEQFDRLNTAGDKTTSNVFRVSIKKCPKCKKGLRYEYTYRKNGSCRSISSTKGLNDLKQKVLSQNLIWWEYG